MIRNFNYRNKFVNKIKMSKFDKLVKSVKKGQIQKTSQILQQAALNINELDPKSGKSLIQISMQNQSTQIFNMLVTYPGIDLQRLSKQGQSSLETAIMLNSTYYVSRLLETGNVNPKRQNPNQETALQVAIKNQTSNQIIKKLVQHKFDLTQHVQRYGSLVNLAIATGQIQNLLFLINYGTQKGDKKDYLRLTSLDQQDNTCLILAVQKEKGDAVSAILQYLSSQSCSLTELQKQFFVNSQNKQGNTALHVACIKNLQTLISLLETKGKQSGLDLTLKNKKGMTPDDIKANTQKHRILQVELKQKNAQQKRIYLKQKLQQKQRQKQQQQRYKKQQKRKRKQQQLLLIKQQQYQKQVTHSKTKWVCGIAVILVVAIMYLVILNAVEQKKSAQF